MAARSNYTPEMREAVHTVKKPFPFVVDVVEFGGGFLLRVYEDEIMKFDVQERIHALRYLAEVREVIESFGYQCELQGAKGGPRRQVR